MTSPGLPQARLRAQDLVACQRASPLASPRPMRSSSLLPKQAPRRPLPAPGDFPVLASPPAAPRVGRARPVKDRARICLTSLRDSFDAARVPTPTSSPPVQTSRCPKEGPALAGVAAQPVTPRGRSASPPPPARALLRPRSAWAGWEAPSPAHRRAARRLARWLRCADRACSAASPEGSAAAVGALALSGCRQGRCATVGTVVARLRPSTALLPDPRVGLRGRSSRGSARCVRVASHRCT